MLACDCLGCIILLSTDQFSEPKGRALGSQCAEQDISYQCFSTILNGEGTANNAQLCILREQRCYPGRAACVQGTSLPEMSSLARVCLPSWICNISAVGIPSSRASHQSDPVVVLTRVVLLEAMKVKESSTRYVDAKPAQIWDRADAGASPTCRICFEEGCEPSDLISPCACRGERQQLVRRKPFLSMAMRYSEHGRMEIAVL